MADKSSKYTLTAISVKNAKAGRHSDNSNGLYLQVKATGAKSWLFRFQLLGKRKEMGLGGITSLSLGGARIQAAELNNKVKNDPSYNPIMERKKEVERLKLEAIQENITFEWCATQYIEANKASWTNPKHVQQWTNTLTTYVYPIIGNMNIKDIELDDMLAVLNPIWYEKTETATRIRGRMEKILSWATVSKYRSGMNPALWKTHLEMVLPKPSTLKNVKHFASLPYSDIPNFFVKLRKKHSVSALALEFLILTAARTHNIMNAKWDQIDFKDELWTIQAIDMKVGNIHIVPLSKRCIQILHDLEQTKTCEYIFEGKSKKHGGLSNNAMDKFLQQHLGYTNITVHGFRSSFKDWSSEITTHENKVSEMALAHTIGNKAEAAYRRGKLIDKRRVMMSDWEAYCYLKL